MVTRTTDDRWENCSRRIITRETGFAHTRTIVNNEGSNFLFHGGGCNELSDNEKTKGKESISTRQRGGDGEEGRPIQRMDDRKRWKEKWEVEEEEEKEEEEEEVCR
jgi:hypothetical protein